MLRYAHLAILLILLFALASTVKAQTDVTECSVLSSAGEVYNLTQNISLSTAMPCINITANNIVFDGGGYTVQSNISSGISGISTAIGVFSNDTTNITIRNLRIFGLLSSGISMYGVQNSTFEYIVVDRLRTEATQDGEERYGIIFGANNSVLRHSLLQNFRGQDNPSFNNYLFGIKIDGVYNTLQNVSVLNFSKGSPDGKSSSRGILLQGSFNSLYNVSIMNFSVTYNIAMYPLSISRSNNTLLDNLRIQNIYASGNTLRIDKSSNTLITNSLIQHGSPSAIGYDVGLFTYIGGTASSSENNTFLNVTYENESCDSNAHCELIRKEYVSINTKNETGGVLASVGVLLKKWLNILEINQTSSASGSILAPVTIYSYNNTWNNAPLKYSATPHEVKAYKTGFITNVTIYNFTDLANRVYNITLYHSTPSVNLTSPSNNTVAGVTKTFVCNVTHVIPLVNITLFVWNSTDAIVNQTTTNISGLDNSSSVQVPFGVSGTYRWSCSAFDTDNYVGYAQNNTVIIDVNNPATTLNAPANTRWLRYKTNVGFNCTTDGANLDSGFLYGNFTGTYSQNQTYRGITSGTQYGFFLNLTDGGYQWSCAANKTNVEAPTFSQQGNFTLGIDTIPPYVAINTISTTVGSQTVTFNSVTTDANSISCKYSVYNSAGAIDGLNNNVSFACNALTSATMTAYGTYNLSIYATDIAGNENASTVAFILTSASGGGGGGPSTLYTRPGNWSMTTDANTRSYELRMTPGSVRIKDLLFLNKELTSVDITLEVTGDAAKYINISETQFVLPIVRDIPKRTSFVVDIPENTSNGIYFANIRAKDKENHEEVITVSIEVDKTIGVLSKLLFLSKPLFGFNVPYFLISVLTGFILAFGSFKMFLSKVTGGAGVAFIIGAIGFFAILFVV